MTFTHTPGPWRITRDHQSPASIEAARGDGGALAKVYLTDPKTRRRTPEYEANATLIAAAPELADALDDLLTWTEALAIHGAAPTPEAWALLAKLTKKGEAVLAKVRGQ